MLKKPSIKWTDYSEKLPNSKIEKWSIKKTTKEENKECYKNNKKDGILTTLYSLTEELKKNNNT
jgi:hypothetical protein